MSKRRVLSPDVATPAWVQATGGRKREVGRIVGYRGVIWLEGLRGEWATSPGWSGPLKFWHARRYARRYGIELDDAARATPQLLEEAAKGPSEPLFDPNQPRLKTNETWRGGGSMSRRATQAGQKEAG